MSKEELYTFALYAAMARANDPTAYDFHLRKMHEAATPERIVALFKKLQEVEGERDAALAKLAVEADASERYATERDRLKEDRDAWKNECQAYRKAKAENDERYLTEREAWRIRAERAESEEHSLRMTNGYLALDVERAMRRAERAEDELALSRDAQMAEITAWLDTLGPVGRSFAADIRAGRHKKD